MLYLPMFALLLAAATPAQAEIRAFADAFDRAQIEGDAGALDRMTSDDLVLINGEGRIEGKADFIASFTTPGVRFDPVTIVSPAIIELGPDAAIVGGEVTLTGSSGGKRFSSRFRFSDTFRRIGGKWQAVYIQVTPVS